MYFHRWKRREFITLLGGAAAAWPLATRAQQGERMRRIGVLMNLAEDDPEAKVRIAAFLKGLSALGWTDGRNMRIDFRWGAGDADRIRKYAAELVTLAPDVIVASAGPTVGPLRQATRTVPIVFASVTDPVGAGFVESLARPGGNATGFANIEYGLSGKWLELLKQVALRVTRSAVLRDPTIASGSGQLGAIQAVAPSLGIEVSPIDVHDTGEMERTVGAFARRPNGSLIVTASTLAMMHRQTILRLAAQHKLPAVYPPTRLRYQRRADLVRARQHRPLPARGWLRRSHPEGRKAGRPSGAGTGQIRPGHQPQDCKGPWPGHAANAARHRRRGDRVSTRRQLITLLGSAAAWPLAAHAQQMGKQYRLGMLAVTRRPWDGLFEGLRDHGYVEGRNLIVERRYSEGRTERWPEIAAELVKLRVDIILVNTTPAALAAKRATSTIPIVFPTAFDPVGAGLAASLSRPGGNVTGLGLLVPEVSAKGLTLLKEAVPRLTQVAVLWNPTNPANAFVWKNLEATAGAAGLALYSQQLRENDIEGAFVALMKEGSQGLCVLVDALLNQFRNQIVDFTIRERLPAAFQFREFVDLGGLMSYGPSLRHMHYRAAYYIDRILKGAKPADLPIEQPTKFELVINLKTARALGLSIPQTLLARADEVIE
jgi:ABC-type uncharacterized transport system substrate-binding protein